MQRAASTDSPINQSRHSGFVIAAIGLHLLLCSIASAATACGDSIDRSARRIPAQVVQALRERAERITQTTQRDAAEHSPGYRLCECPIIDPMLNDALAPTQQQQRWARRVLNLPPPVVS